MLLPPYYPGFHHTMIGPRRSKSVVGYYWIRSVITGRMVDELAYRTQTLNRYVRSGEAVSPNGSVPALGLVTRPILLAFCRLAILSVAGKFFCTGWRQGLGSPPSLIGLPAVSTCIYQPWLVPMWWAGQVPAESIDRSDWRRQTCRIVEKVWTARKSIRGCDDD